MKISRLSVIIPCYQEKENVGRFAEEVFPLFDKYDFPVEFLIVDDGSTDGTREELQQIARRHSTVTVLTHSQNKGLGACLLTAIPRSTGDAVLTLDADLTFHPLQFENLLTAYENGVDCVAGSPMLGELKGVPIFRKMLSNGLNIIYRLLLGTPVTAVSSIFRLYRAESLKRLSLSAQSFQINAEILIKLIRGGGRVVEVPATLTKRLYGESKIQVGREIRNHLEILLSLSRGRL